MLFNDLKLEEPILKALDQENYSQPTPVQEQSIPIVLQRKDLLACAQTGTGKTAAFTIPILQLMNQDAISMSSNNKKISALILTPTRELAIQIAERIAVYGQFLKLRHQVIFGGVSQVNQVNELKKGTDILVATPGRLLDLIQQGYISLASVRYFVLDEADRMLDMGFIHDVRRLIVQLPKKRQSLFFSATMPPEIIQLANSLLTNPLKVAVTPVSSTVDLIEQSIYHVSKQDKSSLLIHLIKTTPFNMVLVFTQMKHAADKIVRLLIKAGIDAAAIHGNKSQNARQKALLDFKENRIAVLVATDIAARGIDISELPVVINYELPNVPETYVHRIGRTGRAGTEGIAISFCDSTEEKYLRDIERLIKKKIPVVKNHPFQPSNTVITNDNHNKVLVKSKK